MAITSTQKQSNMELNCVFGAWLDSAATPAAAAITVGFRPRKVVWENQTDRIKYEWTESNANGTTLKEVAAGTRTLDTADVAISVAQTAGGTAPVTTKPTYIVTVGAAAILQNKQNVYEILGQ